MAQVTLSMPEKEARILIRAMDIAVSYINSGDPYDGIIGEFELTPEETEAFRQKIQARQDDFNQELRKKPGCDDLTDEPIDWPPTDEAMIEYLSGALEEQLSDETG